MIYFSNVPRGLIYYIILKLRQFIFWSAKIILGINVKFVMNFTVRIYLKIHLKKAV